MSLFSIKFLASTPPFKCKWIFFEVTHYPPSSSLSNSSDSYSLSIYLISTFSSYFTSLYSYFKSSSIFCFLTSLSSSSSLNIIYFAFSIFFFYFSSCKELFINLISSLALLPFFPAYDSSNSSTPLIYFFFYYYSSYYSSLE